MSHAGPPPPDEPVEGPAHDAGSDESSGPSGSHAAGAGYNPYPDNWDSPRRPAQSQYAASHPGGDPPAPGAPGAWPPGASDPYASAQNPYASSPPPAAPFPPGNPYAGGKPSGGKPTFGFGGFAGWFTRVGATIVDTILTWLAGFPALFGYIMLWNSRTTQTRTSVDSNGFTTTYHTIAFQQTGTTTALIAIGVLTSFLFTVWNVYFRQGTTGATVGKSILAIRLVNSDLQPIGPGWAFLRQLLHIVDYLPCGLGYLNPIWDSRKQTFADKIMNTFVIQATTEVERPFV